jgi:hypothetical protein
MTGHSSDDFSIGTRPLGRCSWTPPNRPGQSVGVKASDPGIESRLLAPPRQGVFLDADLDGLPTAARRLLGAAIENGTPLAAAARLQMRGSIKLKRWLPFRAYQIIAPGVGFVWRARVAGLIDGFDRSVDGRGEMQWKLARLFTVAKGSGPDVTRSTAGREAGEAFWLPTALLPSFGVEWLASEETHAVARIPTSTERIDVRYEIDAGGHVQSLALQRWGDPHNTGTFGLHTFGGAMSRHEKFGGVTIPTRGAVGWHFGETEWATGEFFRFEVTDLELVL